MSRSGKKYRWVAPDGRRGRWLKTVQGAVISAAAAAHSKSAVKLSFDWHCARALWPNLKAEGWMLECSA